MGLAVSALVGLHLVLETLSPLLGECPSPELVEHIEPVMSYPGVWACPRPDGTDYGPGHQFASVHVELPAESDPLKGHDLIDRMERDFWVNDRMQVTIH